MTDSEKVYSLLNDFMFKFVFGRKSHEHLTIKLLNSLLKLEGNSLIKELVFLNPFNEKDFKDDKISIVDTRVKDSSGKYYNIEIQPKKQRSFIKRFAYYTAKMFSNQLDYSEKFENLHSTIGVALLGFDLFSNSREIDEIFSFKNKKSDIVLKDIIEMHFISLAKSPKADNLKEMTCFEKWVYFLYNSNRYAKPGTKLPIELKAEEYMQEVTDYAQQANSDRELRELMRDRERFLIDQHLDCVDSYEEGVEDGIEEGREEGRREEKRNVIKKLFSKGKTKEDILDLLEISSEEYEKLIN